MTEPEGGQITSTCREAIKRLQTALKYAARHPGAASIKVPPNVTAAMSRVESVCPATAAAEQMQQARQALRQKMLPWWERQ